MCTIIVMPLFTTSYGTHTKAHASSTGYWCFASFSHLFHSLLIGNVEVQVWPICVQPLWCLPYISGNNVRSTVPCAQQAHQLWASHSAYAQVVNDMRIAEQKLYLRAYLAQAAGHKHTFGTVGIESSARATLRLHVEGGHAQQLLPPAE